MEKRYHSQVLTAVEDIRDIDTRVRLDYNLKFTFIFFSMILGLKI